MQRPERAVFPGRLLFRSEVADRGIDGHRPGDPGPVQAGQPERDETAHAVPDHGGWPGDPGVGGHGEHLTCPGVQAVGLPPPAVAVPGQVEGDHPPARRQQRGDVVPPAGMRRAPMDQHDAGGTPFAPGPVGDRRAFGAHLGPFGGSGKGSGEPGRRRSIGGRNHDQKGTIRGPVISGRRIWPAGAAGSPGPSGGVVT